MSDEQKRTDGMAEDVRRLELFQKHQQQAWSDRQSSSDEYDKAILTVASGGLALSIAFIEKIVPLQMAVGIGWLQASWGAFALSILAVVFSFRLSIVALDQHLKHLEKYYLEQQPEYLSKATPVDRWLRFCNWTSGVSLVVAIAATALFAWMNMKERISEMKEISLTTHQIKVHSGRTPVSITPCGPGETKGRTAVPITALPTPAPGGGAGTPTAAGAPSNSAPAPSPSPQAAPKKD